MFGEVLCLCSLCNARNPDLGYAHNPDLIQCLQGVAFDSIEYIFPLTTAKIKLLTLFIWMQCHNFADVHLLSGPSCVSGVSGT